MVLSYPSSTEDDELMMKDDYDYGSDDQSSPSQQNKPTSVAKPASPLSNRTTTKTGLIGEDVVLKCDESITKSNVILWYKDSKLITSGNSVVLPDFSLNPSNYDLTILRASPQNAGDYYCQIMPEKVLIHTKVILGDHSMDVITPESSTSGQSSFHGIAFIWLLFVGSAPLVFN
ncbi:GH20536 [Drosophila grimshawi]|uniref:GH20536 n=1 Tax=Drosophila grimshawi TaxID=7222 RepID=B4J8M9_DROGR|nr:GH20536 [Drosophila grimshawi]